MKLERLEQLIDKRREITMLENRLKEIQYEKTECVSDVVQASSSSFPYTKHSVHISGINMKRVEKLDKLERRLAKRKLDLCNDIDEVYEFIECIEDSKLRQILELRYIKGMSWSVVAQSIYGYPGGDTPRKKVKRYFKEN